MKFRIGLIVLMVFCLCNCTNNGGLISKKSPVSIEPFLEDGKQTWAIGGVGGDFNGKYLKFKLTNNSDEDYFHIISFE